MATLVRLLPRIVCGRPVSRQKLTGEWRVSLELADASVHVMTVGTRTAARTLRDLTEPLALRVHRADLVDTHLLERLESAGLVKITPTEES
jgi:DNA-binding LytR/AlgR family response regulator